MTSHTQRTNGTTYEKGYQYAVREFRTAIMLRHPAYIFCWSHVLYPVELFTLPFIFQHGPSLREADPSKPTYVSLEVA